MKRNKNIQIYVLMSFILMYSFSKFRLPKISCPVLSFSSLPSSFRFWSGLCFGTVVLFAYFDV